MTDRELLERAAKAAGIELLDWCDTWREDDGRTVAAWRTTGRELWNSLVNPADALQLALALNFTIEIRSGSGQKIVSVGVANPEAGRYDYDDQILWLARSDLPDPVRAACRAITEGAAKLAPTM